MLAAARRHAERTGGGNLYADVLAAERAAGTRVVTRNEHWTAYVPAAARWPFEVHVAPHRLVPDIPALSDERAGRLRAALPGPAAPLRRPVRPADALHRGLAPGPGTGRPRAGPPAPSAVQHPAGRGQAEVPGRLRVRRWASSSTTSPRNAPPNCCAPPDRRSGPRYGTRGPDAGRRDRARVTGPGTGRGGPGQGPPQGRDGWLCTDSREGWLIGARLPRGDRGQPSWTRLASRPPRSTRHRPGAVAQKSSADSSNPDTTEPAGTGPAGSR